MTQPGTKYVAWVSLAPSELCSGSSWAVPLPAETDEAARNEAQRIVEEKARQYGCRSYSIVAIWEVAREVPVSQDAVEAEAERVRRETVEATARFLGTRIDELHLSARTHNCLMNAGFRTVREIVQKPEAHLLMIKNFGPWCLNEIKTLLASRGLRTHMRDDEIEKVLTVE